MELSLEQWLVIGICAVLIIGYIYGYYYNRQYAGRIMLWLRTGLGTYGDVTSGEKLPGLVTGGQLIVKNSASPFQRIEAIYLLAPRDNPFFMLFHLIQNRGDELILRITLPRAPRIRREAKRNWKFKYTFDSPETEARWDGFLKRYGLTISHLAIKREAPHIFVRVYLKGLMANPANDFISSINELAE